MPSTINNKRSTEQRSRRPGPLYVQEITPQAFHTIAIDVVLELPPSGKEKYNAALTIVDQFTKTTLVRPMYSNYTSTDVPDILFEAVISKGFLPRFIITDRNPRIVSEVWRCLMDRLKITLSLTSAYHQQADLAERYI